MLERFLIVEKKINPMKKLMAIIFLTCSLPCFCQDEDSLAEKGFDPTNLFTGGSVSVNLGGYNNTFLAGVNPHFGYTFSRWIDAAAVINFQYYTTRDQFNNKYRSTTYGLGLFTRIYPVRFIFLQAQPEYNFIKQKFIPFSGTTSKDNINAPSLLVGAGYTSSRSDKNTFTYLSILVDVLKDINSPYIDGNGNLIPIIRAGFNIGLNRNRNRR
ncbi:MAG: hypothetical protein H0V14_08415 [Chitinophagaceae bacterium]|jgi:hypothetical protein|nr:hypothetical protein [Chitinophagaceae bacterium]